MVQNGQKRCGSLLAATLAAALVLGVAGQVLAQQQSGGKAQDLRQACKADYTAQCQGVQPGGGRIVSCLRQHYAALSPACQQALTAAKAAKQAPAQGQ